MLRRSSVGGLGTTDGLATQSFDPMTSSTSLGYNNHLTSTASVTGPIGNTSGLTSTSRRAYSSMSGRYPRSWHPSPFASDDDASSDEPQFYKEEKKNRIKMEIARRRQQIEENASLHDELTRLAKLRETAEISDRLNLNAYTNSPMSPAMAAAAAAAGVNSHSGTSVLKSVDEILRSSGLDHLTTGHHPTSTADLYGLHTSHTANYGSHGVVADFSPINSDMMDHSGHGAHRTSYRSSSADPTLGGYGGSYGGYTTTMAGSDPYGGKYSKYGSTGVTGVNTTSMSSSLYRKY